LFGAKERRLQQERWCIQAPHDDAVDDLVTSRLVVLQVSHAREADVGPWLEVACCFASGSRTRLASGTVLAAM
jgi:hypothetical protein